jgi:FdhD protein
MSAPKSTKLYQVTRSKQGESEVDSLEFLKEEPLLIRIEDKPYAVVMRTPGQENSQAAGFCLGEGIVDVIDQIKTIGYDEQLDPNVVDVWLEPKRKKKIKDLLGRRGFVSQTSCGICGKEMIKDLQQKTIPIEDDFVIELARITDCLAKLDQHQIDYKATRAAHAALILDAKLSTLAFAEDVGRHNALDKAIGQTLLKKTLSKAKILVMSSRNSYELVQKAGRAHLPVMITISRPTSLAIEMGKALNMTLVFPRKSELIVACGQERIEGIS